MNPTSTETSDPDVVALKDKHRGLWAAGDYSAVAEHIDGIGQELIDELGISAGVDLLDVATGSGNLALAAARNGATVTGLDLVPDLLDVARHRADKEGLAVELVEGDAEALPFADASFDRVTSVVGIQFAPRHQQTADELLRVCRPDGAIGLVNWTPEGLIGQLFKIMGKYMPKPPPFVSPPPAWGDEGHVRELFGDRAELTLTRNAWPFEFDNVENYMEFFEVNYGPTKTARAALSEAGTWDDCRAELRELYEGLNVATDGSLKIPSEYLTIIARPRG